jgi:DNA primase
MTTPAEIVRALGGRHGRCRCPAHDDRTPSLSVSEGPDGRLLTHCFAGCSPERVWRALKDRGLVDREHARCRPCERAGHRQPTVRRTDRADPGAEAVHDRRAEAWEIWQIARPVGYTPAQAYLQARGITREPPGCISIPRGPDRPGGRRTAS